MHRIVFLLLVKFLFFPLSPGINIPGQNLDQNALTSLGVKTLGWQGEEHSSSFSQVFVHHNYSKVNVQKHGVEYSNSQSTHATNFGQNVVSEDDYLELEPQSSSTIKKTLVAQQQTANSFSGQERDDFYLGQLIDTFDDENKDKSKLVQQITNDDVSSESLTQAQIYNAHSYQGDLTKGHLTQQQFEDYPEHRTEENDIQGRQSKKFYTFEKPINVHGFMYSPNREDAQYSNKQRQPAVPPGPYTKCPKMATGHFVYSLSCSQFLNCWKGRGVVQNCAPGTLFNPETLECDFPSKVKCASGPRAPEKPPHFPTQSLKLSCPVGFSGVIPHGSDCSKFVNCVNGAEHIMDCPPGTLFSVKSNVCDFPHKAECASWSSQFGSVNNVDVSFDGSNALLTDGNQDRIGQSSFEHPVYTQNVHGTRDQTNLQGFDLQHSHNQGQTSGFGNKNDYFISSSSTKQYGDNNQHSYTNQGQFSYANKQVGSENQNTYGSVNGNYSSLNRNQNFYGGQAHGYRYNSSESKPLVGRAAKCPDGVTGLYPHPLDCSKFLNCANGQTFIQDCGPGTVFNPHSKVCDFPHKVNCNSVGEARFNGKAQPESRSPPTQSFQSSSWRGEQNTYQQSAGGTQRATVSESKVVVSCPDHASGLYPHPTICSKFLNCANGRTYIQDCGPGTVFNPLFKVCDFPYNVNCGKQYGEGLIDVKSVTVSSITDESNLQTLDSGSRVSQANQNQQGAYNQNVHTSSYQQNRTSQHGFYGQEHNRGSSTASTNHSGYAGSAWQGRDHQVSYGQTHITNKQSQGVTESASSSSFQKQDQHYGSASKHLYNQEQQNKYYEGANRGVSTNNQGGFVYDNQNAGMEVTTARTQPVYSHDYGNKFITDNDQRFQGTVNYPKQYVLTTERPNQIIQSTPKRYHSPAPFPSTDLNADYEFGEASLEAGALDTKAVKNRKNIKECKPLDFHCNADECITLGRVCDGVKDCPNGLDEFTCDKYLQNFTSVSNFILAVRAKERYVNVSVEFCARACSISKGFQCKSFSYRKSDGTCLLTDSNVDLSGALVVSKPYTYYEAKEFTDNCSDKFRCPNRKCIAIQQLCDGTNDCGDRVDEKGCKPESIGYEIKLGGSSRDNEGRIEIKAFGRLGYVCDDKFDLNDADVVCRELGFSLGAIEVKANSYYAQDLKGENVRYWMDDVQCAGNETTLMDCDFGGWGVSNCEPEEVVGVVCKTPVEGCPSDQWKCNSGECIQIGFVCDEVLDCDDASDEFEEHCEAPIEFRLVNGKNAREGRVEVRHNGIWGTVCDDDINDDAAKVICKSLGFSGKASIKKDGFFGAGYGPIWLDQVFCSGNESSLGQCSHWNWGEHNCEHSEDVGVICSNFTDSIGTARNAQIDPRYNAEDNFPEPLLPEKCGLRKDDLFSENDDVHFRVVKGSFAKPGDYPWQASLRIKNHFKPSLWCGAVIISRKFILTAAHCLKGFSKGAYLVIAGDYDTDKTEGTEQEVYIDEFYIHDQFREGHKMNNDIALVKLKGKGFTFNKDVKPICLPEADLEYKTGLNCTISGFGSTESGKSGIEDEAHSHQMRAGWVPIQSHDVCKMPHVYGSAITEGMVCAGTLEGGVDACDGDSGGPLACLHDGVFTLYGIISWGHHCGYANKPGVYAKVAHYREWIDETMKRYS